MIARIIFNGKFYLSYTARREPSVPLSRQSKNPDTKMSRSQQFSSYKRSKLIKIRTIKFIFVSIGKAFMNNVSSVPRPFSKFLHPTIKNYVILIKKKRDKINRDIFCDLI